MTEKPTTFTVFQKNQLSWCIRCTCNLTANAALSVQDYQNNAKSVNEDTKNKQKQGVIVARQSTNSGV